MAGATQSIVINAAVQKVFDIINDYDKYPEFLSEVKRLTTSGRQGNEVQVHYEIEMMKLIKYTLKMKAEPPTRVSWTWGGGEFMKDNKGSWTLEDLGGGQTKATYHIEVALGPLVPKAIINTMVEKSLPKMLEAFKKRAETT